MSETKHWSKFHERGSYWGIRILLIIYKIIGRYGLFLILFPVVVYFYLTGFSARKASLDFHQKIKRYQGNSEAVSHWLGIQHFLSFASAAFDKIDAWIGRISGDDLCYTNYDDFKKLIEHQQGAVFIGSHLGNLEVCRALSHGKYKIKINVLVFTQHAVEFNRVMNQLNPSVGVNLIEVSELGPELAISLHEKIAKGEILVIVGDRTSVTTQGRVSYVDFLGYPAPFSQGPFILASLMECPVFLLFCLKEKNKYRIVFEPLTEQLKFKRKVRQQQLTEIIKQYADRLGHYAVKYPLQWFNFYDFWQSDNKVER